MANMKLSKKVQVAVEALTHVGLKQGSSPVNLTVISRELNVSVSYLEGIFQSLRLAGCVSPVRGPGGGYRLGKTPQDISVASLAFAVEPQQVDGEPEDSSAEAESPIRARTRWLVQRAHETELAFLEQVTLQDLLVQATRRDRQRRNSRPAVHYEDLHEEEFSVT
jgi:Rrf2 family transcriptional regulator, iron-sulfur cluster assembly transcription factor